MSLLSQGFEVDSKDREGVTPLRHAAESSKEVTFQMLIQKGANASLKDNKGSSLLHRAAIGGNTSIINKPLLLGLEIDTRSDDGFTPLMAAALVGKQSAFKMLLRHEANVSLKDNKGVCLLHWAVQGEDTCIINTMLSLGLETDSRNNDGVTPLLRAALTGKQSAFQLLIQNGADLTLEDNNGCSLLHKATQGGTDTSIVNELSSLGLERDSRNNHGVTPLMAAACCGKQSSFELLLQHGADASLKDNLGNCLLHWAAQGRDTSIINKMLWLGLDVNSRNNAGTLQK